ncbi:uncharacterized protein AB675_5620 [Cyphellophora attinorum]|uniref:Uncharacterized protein n=1 Tax=Cyphellophora attinorum TaxID=1664694 RepID=A0A0N1HD00_9EURO|nr:uncharacterized protein AB675_5620 [Phialophora attinorum]KPI41975.1 hypothetical protein AB675_5620 [Phialophora attinorum]
MPEAEKEARAREDKGSHPPPPCDPFQRYQTPWPRTERDDDNPFIRFRRFADNQFRAMFHGSWPFQARSIAEEMRRREEEAFETMLRNGRLDVGRGILEAADAVQQNLRTAAEGDLRSREMLTREPDDARASQMYSGPADDRTKFPALEDYKRQLQELEESNKRRLMMARQEQDSQVEHAPVPSPAEIAAAKRHVQAMLDEAEPQLREAQTELDLWDRMEELPSQTQEKLPFPFIGPAFERTRGEELDPFRDEDHFWPYMLRSPFSPLAFPRGREASMRPGDRAWMTEAFNSLYRDAHHGDGQSDEVVGLVVNGPNGLSYRGVGMGAGIKGAVEVREEYEGEFEDTDKTVPEIDSTPQATPIASIIAQVAKEVESFAGSFADAFSVHRAATAREYRSECTSAGQDSIVSTMTRTESRTLPDGSVETRRVLRRRFADGKEESEESVDYAHPQTREVPQWLKTHLAAQDFPTVDKQTQTTAQTQMTDTVRGPKQVEDQGTSHEKPRKSGGGWFWR